MLRERSSEDGYKVDIHGQPKKSENPENKEIWTQKKSRGILIFYNPN